MIIANRSLNLLGNEISLGGKYLQYTECSMFLGIKLDNKLKFADHINFIVNKLSKSIGIFAKIKNKLPLNSRLNYYYSFVYPFITYNQCSKNSRKNDDWLQFGVQFYKTHR